MAVFSTRFVLLNTAFVIVSGMWGCSSTSHNVAQGLCQGACSCSGATCTCEPGGTCTLGSALSEVDAGMDAGPVDAGVQPPNGITFHCDSKNHCDLTC